MSAKSYLNKLSQNLHTLKVYGLGIGLKEADIKDAERFLYDLKSEPESAITYLKDSSDSLRNEINSKAWKRDKIIMKYALPFSVGVIGTISVNPVIALAFYGLGTLDFIATRKLFKLWENGRLKVADNYERIAKELEGLTSDQIKQKLEGISPKDISFF